jgi:hypothetical protein
LLCLAALPGPPDKRLHCFHRFGMPVLLGEEATHRLPDRYRLGMTDRTTFAELDGRKLELVVACQKCGRRVVLTARGRSFAISRSPASDSAVTPSLTAANAAASACQCSRELAGLAEPLKLFLPSVVSIGPTSRPIHQ